MRIGICSLIFAFAAGWVIAFSLKSVFAQTALSLDLKQSVKLALRNNLATVTAEEKQNEARGRELEALSQLLPNFYATASQTNLTANLAATGFPLQSFSSPINPVIGPYNNFDARLQLAQTLFNLSAYRRHQASQAGFLIAGLQTDLTREQVAAATEVAYLNVLASREAVQSAQADVDLAESLAKLARDQHDAGIATGVDVARAETILAEQQVILSSAQTTAAQARIQFKRLIGVPLDSKVALTESLEFKRQNLPPVAHILTTAFRERLELKIADEEVRFNDYSLQAALDEQIPSFGLSANYGESGNTVKTLALPTRAVGIRMDIPIFNGELTRGHIVEAESRKHQAELTRRDTRVQVEEDVRLALETLDTSARGVESANQSLDLAERELVLARDRFAAGLSDNIEVIQAQTALENARNAQVSALAEHNRARVNLASSLGEARNFDFKH